MELDRETVTQILIAGGAVAFFIVAAMGLSLAFGSHPDLQNASAQGTLNGTVAQGAVTDGTIDGAFNGTLDVNRSASIEDVNGTLTGTIDNGNVTGRFVGKAAGTVDGSVNGTVEGTYDADARRFSGQFNGSISGVDAGINISETGGIAIVAVLAGFIVLMAVAGLYLERQEFEDS